MSRLDVVETCFEDLANSSRFRAGAQALLHDAYDWSMGLKSPPISNLLHARAFNAELWRAAQEPRQTLIEEFTRAGDKEFPWHEWKTDPVSSFHPLDHGLVPFSEIGSIGINRLRDGTHTLTSFDGLPKDWSVHIARGGRLRPSSDASASLFDLSTPKFSDITAFLSPTSRNPSLFDAFNRGRSIPVPSDAIVELRMPGGLVRRAISTPAIA